MTKKRIGTMAACLALVGAVAVGGTLALLSSQSNSVTNTFTVGSGYNDDTQDPDLKLDEAVVVPVTKGDNIGDIVENPDGSRTPTTGDQTQKYPQLIEGSMIAKDPQFHISDDCEVAQSWIVAKVSGFNAEKGKTTLKFTDVTDETVDGVVDGAWLKVEKTKEGAYTYTPVTTENMGNGVYIFNASLSAGESTKDLFQQLQVDNFVAGQNPSTITVTGYAVEGVADVSFDNMRDDVMKTVDTWVFGA